ncbi:hypothetical protein [Longimicrobium sp.]|uniref:hypothetical protein n=1 Tax=Longimicrobium sp. TaxID=2029185 RepID=UPI003B3A6DF2
MILDLNALTVESFDTDAGSAELQMLPRTVTKNVVVCFAEGTQACLVAPTPDTSCGC